MTNIEAIRAIVEYLEKVQKRPKMYLSSETSASLHDQLWGLEIGLRLFGLQMDPEIFRRI